MLDVTSEVGRLRKVLVHEPGPEVDVMVPSMMDELLFDDILFGDRAREEHRRLRRIFDLLDVAWVDARDLLVEALDDAGARSWLLEVLAADLPPGVDERLRRAPAAELADQLIAGVRREPCGTGVDVEDLFLVPPLPNACFQRDPQVVVGDGVMFGAMATPARYREALLSRTIFRFHPELRRAPVWFEPLDPSHNPLLFGIHRPSLEGGDVEVVSADVLVVGLSERTNRTSVELMVRALRRRATRPRWLVVVAIPRRRAYMHLDTIFTPIDRDACLVHPPVILGQGRERAEVWAWDLEADDPRAEPCEGLLEALAARGVDLEPVPCGGDDPISQQREQWTDGANALAVCPGVILLYDRNVRTVEQLDRRGFAVIPADDLLLGRREFDLAASGRAAILLPSHEVARARGGPHCLTHPLVREPVA
ncbi:MAG: arginine deiminase [Acidobacteriota bacterium]